MTYEAHPSEPVPMYCPGCDHVVPENYDRYDEAFKCGDCGSLLYESKESHIQTVHATARFNKEYGHGPFWDGDRGDRSREEAGTDGGPTTECNLSEANE